MTNRKYTEVEYNHDKRVSGMLADDNWAFFEAYQRKNGLPSIVVVDQIIGELRELKGEKEFMKCIEERRINAQANRRYFQDGDNRT
jgi:hypothetical protein